MYCRALILWVWQTEYLRRVGEIIPICAPLHLNLCNLFMALIKLPKDNNRNFRLVWEELRLLKFKWLVVLETENCLMPLRLTTQLFSVGAVMLFVLPVFVGPQMDASS